MKFAECKGVMEETEYLTLKNTFIHFLNNMQETLLSKLENEQFLYGKEGIFSAKKISQEIELVYKQQIKEFYQIKITPVKLGLIRKFEKYLLENGLPEIMAVGYALGEWSFKARDIIFETTSHEYNFFKIDHERCLWEISHALLIDLKVADILESIETISNQ